MPGLGVEPQCLEVAPRRLVVPGEVGVRDAHVEPPAGVLGLELQGPVQLRVRVCVFVFGWVVCGRKGNSSTS